MTATPGGSLQAPRRVRTTKVAWEAKSDLTLEEWRHLGPRLGTEARASNWWLGDWAKFGSRRLGQTYGQAAQITGYDEQTLHNMAWVAGRYPTSRRREALSWSHHAELAALEESEQERWLARASDKRLSVQALRSELRNAKRRTQPESDDESIARSAAKPMTIVCPHCGLPFETQSPAAARND